MIRTASAGTVGRCGGATSRWCRRAARGCGRALWRWHERKKEGGDGASRTLAPVCSARVADAAAGAGAVVEQQIGGAGARR